MIHDGGLPFSYAGSPGDPAAGVQWLEETLGQKWWTKQQKVQAAELGLDL